MARWLAHADKIYKKKPSKHDELVPIVVNEKILDTYQELKRFNVIFPKSILQAVDEARKKIGIKRSTFLQKAAEKYLLEQN